MRGTVCGRVGDIWRVVIFFREELVLMRVCCSWVFWSFVRAYGVMKVVGWVTG